MESGSLAAGWVSEVVIGFVGGFSVFPTRLQLLANTSDNRPISSRWTDPQVAGRVRNSRWLEILTGTQSQIESYEAPEPEASDDGTRASGVLGIGPRSTTEHAGGARTYDQ